MSVFLLSMYGGLRRGESGESCCTVDSSVLLLRSLNGLNRLTPSRTSALPRMWSVMLGELHDETFASLTSFLGTSSLGRRWLYLGSAWGAFLGG